MHAAWFQGLSKTNKTSKKAANRFSCPRTRIQAAFLFLDDGQ